MATKPTNKAAKKTAAKAAKKTAAKAAKTTGAKTAKVPGNARERAKEIHTRLSTALPAPRVELNHENPWQLLIATILSAQSTDKRVNMVTPVLFARFPTPHALARSTVEEVETLVKATGFFRNKTKSIRAASLMIDEKFGGEVPRTMEEIIQLPGVARKTANVVLGSGYRIASGIVIDTHAGRVARRLGLTDAEDPVKVEMDLMGLFPKEAWIDTGHRFVLHGRYVCVARKPRCAACPINELCPSREAKPLGDWQARAKDYLTGAEHEQNEGSKEEQIAEQV